MKFLVRNGLLAWAFLIAPQALFCQVPIYPNLEIAALRIESAASELQRVKPLVEGGAEARIKLEEAERNLGDARDEAILEGMRDPNDSVEDAMVAAAQRRLDRSKAWIDKLKKLIDLGFMSESDLQPFEKGLSSRQADLTWAQSNALFRSEAANRTSLAERLRTLQLDPQEVAKDMEHYQGVGAFDETRDLQPLAKAFETEFDRPLPISADGETAVHRALGFDHRGRIDVAINPSAPEGIWLRQYLRLRKIPYYAFTRAIAGKATAAHIHIGPGSTSLFSPAARS